MAWTGPALVVDASVLVKWFLKEEFSEQSLRLRAAHASHETKIVVPTLAKYEVLNALRYSGGFGAQELLEVSEDMEGYQLLEVAPHSELWREAMKIALDCGLTIYDSCYLAVARASELEFYTADGKLLERVKGLGFARHIRTLGREAPR